MEMEEVYKFYREKHTYYSLCVHGERKREGEVRRVLTSLDCLAFL